MNNYLKHLLKINERSPSWLSRKIGVSHTLVHYWVKNERNLNEQHLKKIVKVFNIPLKKALKDFKKFD